MLHSCYHLLFMGMLAQQAVLSSYVKRLHFLAAVSFLSYGPATLLLKPVSSGSCSMRLNSDKIALTRPVCEAAVHPLLPARGLASKSAGVRQGQVRVPGCLVSLPSV